MTKSIFIGFALDCGMNNQNAIPQLLEDNMTQTELLELEIGGRLLDFAAGCFSPDTRSSEEIRAAANAQAREIMTMCGVKEPRKMDQQQLLI